MKFITDRKLKKANKAYRDKMQEAMEAQRRGDIQAYAALHQEAQALLARVQELELGSQ